MNLEEAALILSAVAQPTRLEILHLVAPYSRREGDTGLAAGEIARALSLAPATLSFHLKDMTYKGLLVQTRHGRSVHYRADLDELLRTLDFIVTEICEG